MRAFAVLPVLPADLSSLDACLEHLVAAADEAAAAGIPTTLLLPTPLPPPALAPALAEWEPLIGLLEDVDLAVQHRHESPTRELLLDCAAQELAGTVTDPARAVVLTTTCAIAVGPDWITEHVRHHRAGARASTGPVRGHDRRPEEDEHGQHEAGENLAVRADLLPSGALTPAGRQQIPLVHAVTPVVTTLRVTLQAFP